MTTLTATKAREKLYTLLNEIQNSHDPVLITGKSGNGILISEEDWKSIEETMYLLSVPGLREDVKEGIVAPISEFKDKLDW